MLLYMLLYTIAIYTIAVIYYCYICCYILLLYITFGRQHRKDIDLYLKPFRGNNNIINLNTSYEKNVQLSSNKYLLLLYTVEGTFYYLNTCD